jgi:hypothetical protein
MEHIEIIKDLVIRESGIDIGEKSRKRNVIELRSLFYNVAKKLKPMASYSAIGRSVGVDHATVLHSMKMFEVYTTYNKELDKLKNAIINRYRIEHKFYGIQSIEMEIERLEQQIAELKQHKEFLENEKKNLVV